MNRLTQAEKAFLVRCIQDGMPLPADYLSRLIPQEAKPQLVWPGKGLHYPLSDAEMELCEFFAPDSNSEKVRDDTDWHNKLILGDNLEIMAALRTGRLAEKIKKAGGLKLIYIDPPFNAGENFFMTSLPQNSGGSKYQIPVYSDKWPDGITGYLSMIHPRLKLMHDLLADDGCIYVHCDWRVNSFLRLILDELFAVYVNEICWHYTGGGRSAKRFSRKHDTILIYSKTDRFPFNPEALRIPYSSTSSYAKSGIRGRNGKRYSPNPLGKLPDDVWDIPIINPLSGERNGYPTQKPEKLLTCILLASSAPGDLVADFFCGSGTLPAVAARLGRKWIAVDNSPHAIHAARKRLIRLAEDARSNDVANPAFEIWKAVKDSETGKRREGKNYPARSFINCSAMAALGQDSISGSERFRSQITSGRKNCILCHLMNEDSNSSGRSSHLNLIKNAFSDSYEYGIKIDITNDYFTVSLTGISVLSAADLMNEAIRKQDTNSEEIVLSAGEIFKISRKKSGYVEKVLLSNNWTDWIDYWAVDAWSGLNRKTDESLAGSLNPPFRVSWYSFRKRNSGIELTSRPLPIASCTISIKVIDILANETIQKINF